MYTYSPGRPTTAAQERRHEERERKRARMTPLQEVLYVYWPAALVIVAGIVTITILRILDPGPASDPRESWTVTVETQHDAEYRYEADPYAIGDVAAPSVIVYYGEYMCGACDMFATQTVPELQQYIDDGFLRIEYRDVGFTSEATRRAARGGYAAAQQDAYLAYHAAMHDGTVTPDDMQEEAILETAVELGLDAERFRDDLNSREAVAVVEANEAQFESLGFTAVPSMIAGGTPIHGGQPVEVFTDWLDEYYEQDSGRQAQ